MASEKQGAKTSLCRHHRGPREKWGWGCSSQTYCWIFLVSGEAFCVPKIIHLTVILTGPLSVKS